MIAVKCTVLCYSSLVSCIVIAVYMEFVTCKLVTVGQKFTGFRHCKQLLTEVLAKSNLKPAMAGQAE